LALAGTNAWTSAATINAGTLSLGETGEISGTTLSLNSSPSSIVISSGAATFSGAVNVGNNNGANLLAISGGTFSSASLDVGRGAAFSSEPTAAPTTAGLYVSGGSVAIGGNLTLNGSNSSATGRIDDGELTVGGKVVIGLGNTGRWSVLDVNGGALSVADAATGVQIGSTSAGNALFLVRAGTATVERVTFNRIGVTATLAGVANVKGGALYVGSGGFVVADTNENFSTTIKLSGGVLGATADWATSVNVVLGAAPVFQAADGAGVPHDITMNGVLSGLGFTKTGDGVLTLSATNTYTGTTAVQVGTLRLGVDTAIPSGSAVTLTTGSTLDLAGFDASAASLAGTGTLKVSTTSSLTLSGALTADLAIAVDPAGLNAMQTYTLATCSGTPSGTYTCDLPFPWVVKAVPGALQLSSSRGSMFIAF